MRKIIFFAMLFMSVFGQLTAQDSPVGDQKLYKPVEYLPIHRFPLGIQHVYRFTDTTEVIKLLPDSTKVKYKRVVTHFFTLNRAKPDKDGFMTFEVSLDSMRYYFKQGKAEINWDSQDDASGGINFRDLKYASVPLGRFFDMTISPYGEIAKISGGNMDWFIGYLDKYADQLPDTIEKFIWYDGVSSERFGQITDVKKIEFPQEKIPVDSSWITPFSLQIEYINFADTVKAKITDVTNGYMTIEAVTNNLRALPGRYLFYDIKDMLLPVLKSKGNGKYSITLSPRGHIEKAKGNFLINLEIPVHKDIFKLEIKSSMDWELLGMYKL